MVRIVDMPPLARDAVNGYSASAAQMSVTWIVRRSRRIRALTVPATGTDSPIAYDTRSGPCRATRRRCSPSRWKMAESIAPHSRAAFSTTAFMTGWRSVGELAITRRISAVASSAARQRTLLQLLEQADILDCDDRLSGEGLEQLDLPRGEGHRVPPNDGNRPDRPTLPQHRRHQDGPDAGHPHSLARPGRLRIRLDVGHVHDRPVQDGPRAHILPSERNRAHGSDGFVHSRTEVVGGDAMELLPVEPPRRAGQPVEEAPRAPDDGVERRLDIGRRARDYPQDLGRRRLLLEGLGQCLSEAFDLGLQVIRVGPRDKAGPLERAGAFLAKLRLRAILVLAAGTVHTKRLPISGRSRPARHSVTASGPPSALGVPAVPWGAGAPTLPRPGLGRQMGGSGAWLALGACGETQNSRLRHAPDSYTPSWRLGPALLEPPVESADGDAVAPPRDRAP